VGGTHASARRQTPSQRIRSRSPCIPSGTGSRVGRVTAPLGNHASAWACGPSRRRGTGPALPRSHAPGLVSAGDLSTPPARADRAVPGPSRHTSRRSSRGRPRRTGQAAGRGSSGASLRRTSGAGSSITGCCACGVSAAGTRPWWPSAAAAAASVRPAAAGA
jgi:hypothetical protein